jgi:hypothetical protein
MEPGKACQLEDYKGLIFAFSIFCILSSLYLWFEISESINHTKTLSAHFPARAAKEYAAYFSGPSVLFNFGIDQLIWLLLLL